MAYPVANVAAEAVHPHGFFGTAAFALVLFILLVIILRACY